MISRQPLPDAFDDGPFTTAEAAAEGIGRGRLRGPNLARPFRGVRSTSEPDSLRDRARALLLTMAPGSFFCGLTAAGLIGLPVPPSKADHETLHIAIPNPGRATRLAGATGHKLQIEECDRGVYLGLPITTPARTWCDLSPSFRIEDLVAAGDHLLHNAYPLSSKSDLKDCVTRYPGRRGRGRLIEAFSLLDAASESAAESIIRTTLVRAGFAGLVANHEIRDANGRVWARADLCFPEHRVIVEYQGDYHRTEKDRWRKDRSRIAALTAAGWHVLEIAAGELYNSRGLTQLVRAFLSLHPRLPAGH